uniref:Fibronectin type-III domain-containing protein n=1 Tax=Eptatretus burgeri TaxID=7764 RepID=A0A8C4QF40_EPTBU
MGENENGVGEPYETPEPVVTSEEPAPPKHLKVVDTTRTSVSLAWTKPDHDGGSRISSYMIEMKQKGSDHWLEVIQTKQLTATIDGLVENSEYELRVRAKNDAGYSEPREAFSSVIIKEPLIEPEVDFSGIPDRKISCKAGATFSIDVPYTGRPLPKVMWKHDDVRLKTTERIKIKTTKERTMLTVKDSMRADSGRYNIVLENSTGVMSFAVMVNVFGKPGPISGHINVSSMTVESCVLSWNEPEDDGGSPITNYIVEKRESGSSFWQLVNSSVKRTQIKVTHLAKYMEYTFRVTAENRFGCSRAVESNAVIAEHPFLPPSAPTHPEVYFVSATAMAIRWEEPYHDGGSKVTGYWIEKKERNSILWVKENNLPCLECNYKVTSLVEGLEYQFRIYAMNAAGMSKPSEASKPIAQN